MSITTIFFSFWRKASMPLLVVALMLCYFTMPDNAAIHHDETGNPDGFVGKQSFFYITFAVILGFNFLLNLLKTQLLKIEFIKINPTSAWAKNSKKLNILLKGWFNAFVAITNTFLAFVLIGLRRINSTDGQKLDFDYTWILIIGSTLLMVLVFFLPLRLLFSDPGED